MLLNSAVPPQDVASTSVAASFRSASVAATSPRSEGAADQIRATVAAVCGEAIDVPDFAT